MTAKKDKKLRQIARKRKMQRRTQPSGQQTLLKCVQTSEHLKNTKVIALPPGTEKMSEVILRFAEPLKDQYGDLHPKRMQFAILVWNTSLLPPDEQQQAINDIVRVVPDSEIEEKRDLLLTIEMLLERKQRHFADNKRVIMDCQITETADRIDLNVVSTVPQGYEPAPETER